MGRLDVYQHPPQRGSVSCPRSVPSRSSEFQGPKPLPPQVCGPLKSHEVPDAHGRLRRPVALEALADVRWALNPTMTPRMTKTVKKAALVVRRLLNKSGVS